jgi:biotin-dependent carboxylase-like uncharacterized protein
MSRRVEVVRSGPLTTVQDLGRFGHRSIGVSPSGAADRGAMARANALTGNPADAAVLEATFGGLSLRALDPVTVAVTGAVCAGALMDVPVELAAGDTLTLDGARTGVRTYVAVSGGIDVAPVLGSRSTDTLSGLGPPPVAAGQVLAIGTPAAGAPSTAEPPALPQVLVDLEHTPGPRADWLPGAGWGRLDEASWEVSPDSNRVAVRLRGAAAPVRDGSLPPEPLMRGAVQIPPDGRPIVFLADHPVTGGYPVVAVLTPTACDLIAQCRTGTSVRLVSAHLDHDGASHPTR